MSFARGVRRFKHFAWIGVLFGVLGAVACASDDFEPEPGGDAGTGGGGSDAGSAGVGGAAGSAGAPAVDGSKGDAAGSACTDGSSCESGFCTDGVCCDTKCDGVCESCAGDGTVGTCTPYAAGTDPELECSGSAPDSCADDKQTVTACGGESSCGPVEIDCAPYACAGTSCATSCKTDSECASGAWCSAGVCEMKKPNGEKCGSDAQCASSRCAGGYCCAGSCAAPNSCETGQCKCGGVVCGTGASCEMFWADKDADGFGAPSELDIVACSNQPPVVTGTKYVLSKGAKTDCLDTNKNVFPGQTQYFGVHRGDGSFDYDCNGAQDQQYKEVGASATCTTCKVPLFNTCMCVGGYYCNAGTCQGTPANKAFKQPVACGGYGTLGSCGIQSGTICGIVETKSQAQQLCR